jgi:hypothetical protein
MRPLNLFEMFEEADTMGLSGAQARQVELNTRTTSPANLTATDTQMAALELADTRGLVNLQAAGLRNGVPVLYSWRSDQTYKDASDAVSLTHAQLISDAQAGAAILTLTAQLRSNWGTDNGPQPLLGLATTGSNGVTGDPPLPVVASGNASNPPAFTLVGTDVRSDATLLIDGAPATGTLTCSAGTTGLFCVNGNVSVDINQAVSLGLHLLQLQNPAGPLSNELPFCVGTRTNCNS